MLLGTKLEGRSGYLVKVSVVENYNKFEWRTTNFEVQFVE